MTFELPPLPYADDALAPHISSDTLALHHGKHHAGYVDNLNRLVEGTDHEGRSLEDVILAADGALLNNAGQTWNHTFYWSSMRPGGGGDPTGDIATAIAESFGGAEQFRKEFTEAATGQFGSGWAWLVADGDRLEIMSTANADLPMRHGRTALLTLDVWEHAYYLDHQNRRAEYVEAFLQHLINWDFAAANLAG